MKNKVELLSLNYDELNTNEQDKLLPYFGLDHCDICKAVKEDKDTHFLDTDENENNQKIQNLLDEGVKIVCTECLESFESWRG
jgi:hypothetical protein